MLNRLAVVVQIIVIPVYFFGLANILPFVKLPFIYEQLPILNIFIVRILVPLTLSLPFVLFTWFKRYQLADTYEDLGTQVWKLPLSIKIFYGINFIIISLFALPLVAPIIGLAGGYYLGILLFGRAEEGPNIKRVEIKFVFTVYLIYAMFIALVHYIQVWEFFDSLIQLWIDNIDILYLSALNLADAVIFSSIVVFIFEFRRLRDNTLDIPPIGGILTIILFFFLEGFLLGFYYTEPIGLLPDVLNAFNIIHITAFLANIILLFLRWLFQMQQDEESTSIYVWITIIIFQLVNVASEDIKVISRTFAITLTCIIFMILFIISYRNVSRNYY